MADYRTPHGDSLSVIVEEMKGLRRLISELERPSGTNIGSLVAQVQAKLADIEATVISTTNTYLSTGTVYMTNVSASGNLAAAGVVSGATGLFPNGVKSVDVYNRLVSGSPYKVQYVDNTGQMGYVPSSRRYKRDIKTAKLNVQTIMSQLRVVTFRYLNAVALNGNEAPTEWGVIAEEIHDLGLTWLVDYNEAGEPDGVKHERFAILLIMDSQNKQSQIDALDQRIRSLGG